MKKILLALFLFTSGFSVQAESLAHYSYQRYFEAAYAQYPSIPKGLLEAVAWSNTRITHLTSDEAESCIGYPRAFGVMGLTYDGKGYFNENLKMVSAITGISEEEIINSPEKNILAFAKAYDWILKSMPGKNKILKTGNNIPVSTYAYPLLVLSEIPDSGIINAYARDAQLYQIFSFLKKNENASQYHFPHYTIDLENYFGDNYSILSSSKNILTPNGITNASGSTYNYATYQLRSGEYAPALWVATPTCNYSSRNGTAISAITIHTIQGTYAGAISWAQNCSSSVSYHYVVRSSDGQITQMVLEASKAWHVGSENPYTIGYEHDGYVSQPQWYTTALYTASADLSRDVCNSGYGINPLRTYFGASSSGTNVLGGCTKIKGHQHYPNQTHTDPGIYWDWERYYKLINNAPSQTTLNTASGAFYDTGGAGGNYSDDQRYLTLISPAGATSVTLTFSAFSIESNWDYIYIYDGATTNSPLIGVYTGTNSPGTVTSTGGSLLVEFRSDCSTVQSGWAATWTSNATPPPPSDLIAPTTAVTVPGTWVTQNFTASFTDTDNSGGSGIEKSYYQVIDFDGTDWRANADHGFFSDNFDLPAIHADWYDMLGTWSIVNGTLEQSDEAEANSNLYAYIDHSLSNRYLYNWSGKMEGTGTNRRAGFHYFCDDATQSNRGNSYFVWFRLDNDKVQLYKVVNDVFTLADEVTFDFNAAQWYDFKVIYDRITGKHTVYIDNVLVQTWTDSSPYSGGDYISFRSGNCKYTVNNLKVYRSRNASVSVTVGATGDLRYQNTNPTTPAGKVKSIVADFSGNLSAITSQDVNVDWTNPANVLTVNDGPNGDISVTTNNTELQANWSSSSDVHSDVARYWYAIGTSAGATDVLNWTDNFWYDTVVVSGLSLNFGTTYYFSVRAENGAGLLSNITSSDGQLLQTPSNPPVAVFAPGNTFICSGSTVNFQNNSSDATSFSWIIPGGTPSTSTNTNPDISFATSGTYSVTLVANGPGGTDTVSQNIAIDVSLPVVADFTESDTLVYLPNAFVGFTNLSTNANGYYWDFGDGTGTSGISPWHQYSNAGIYSVALIAVNNACPADTTYQTITVMGSNGIDDETSAEGLTIYQAGANQLQTIFNCSEAANYTIEVYTSVGKMVYSSQHFMNAGLNSFILHPGYLSSGAYVFRVYSDEKSFVKKFIHISDIK